MSFDDHDQRFKALLREFFADFLRLFFADWAAVLDLAGIAWLEQEVLPDPPDGSRHVIDLLARTTAVPDAGGDPYLLLVHVEIESPDRTTDIKARLPRYYAHLRDKHPTARVLPVVVYLSVGLGGVGIDTAVEYTGTLDVLTFKYLYVGLPALPAEEYVRGDNWLGVALSALMRIPAERVAWLGAEALRRLGEAEELSDQQRYLLAECVHNYLPLEDEQVAEFERIMKGTPTGRNEYVKKTLARRAFDEGLEQGIEKGREEGIEKGLEHGRAMLLRVATALLAGRFGTVSPDAFARLDAKTADELAQLALAIPTATALADLGL